MTGTLDVGIIALVLSASTGTWHVAQFLLGASRPTVELEIGAAGRGGIVAGPLKPKHQAAALQSLIDQGYTQPIVSVKIRNKGRLAVSVTGWAIAFDNGFGYQLPGWDLNAGHPLPYRLEPGSEVSYYCPLEDVTKVEYSCREAGPLVHYCQAQASFGTGKVLKSKITLALPLL